MNSTANIDDDPRWLATRRLACAFCRPTRLPIEDISDRVPCPDCGATTCAGCANPCRGCALSVRMRAVCDGREGAGAEPPFGDGEYKTFHIVRTFGASRDVLLSPSRIIVRAIGDARRHSYFADAAPAVLRLILHDTKIARLDRPLVAPAKADLTWPRLRMRSMDEIAWLIPMSRGVEIRFRPPPIEGMPTSAIDIPVEGPWALPKAWTPPDSRVVIQIQADGGDIACPHCRRVSRQYRSIGDGAFVCGQCGRSFEDAVLRERLDQQGS